MLKNIKKSVSSFSPVMLMNLIKSRRMRWAGYVARMRRRGMHIGYWWETQEERDHLEDLDVGGLD
jgi:hypothetical protein